MATEFRVLGPVEAITGSGPARLGPRPRAVLAVLLLYSGQVVPTSRLVDALWGDLPPDTAPNIVQGYVSQLRKALDRDLIETRDPGYLIRVERDALDLHRFERLAADGARSLEEGRPGEAADVLRDALGLWRGDALADVADGEVLRPAAARLDELRLVALERRLDADLACGRHAELVGELELLTGDHPLRERLQGLLMTTLYRCDRQAEALEVYRATRQLLVDDLGLEPGAALQDLQQAILRHDPALDAPAAPTRDIHGASHHTVLVAALDAAAITSLIAVAEPLAREGDRELVLSSTVADAGMLGAAASGLRGHRERLHADGMRVRAAAFTSLTPGADLGRLAREQDAELVLVDAPAGLLEDARLVGLLDDAPCDVAILVPGAPGAGAVLVPFAGAEHDWAAVELGAWLARTREAPLVLAGSTGDDGRDASRLLASASLAVQRALGVDAEPLLVEPTPQALVAAAESAGLVVVGLTERWRHEGVGRARTALATSPHHPTLLVRRGLRPGGLAPRSAETRFTWTIAG